MSADINGDGIADRPDFVAPLQYNTRNPNCYVVDARNPACGATHTSFADLPAGSLRFGSAGRNIIIRPRSGELGRGRFEKYALRPR